MPGLFAGSRLSLQAQPSGRAARDEDFSERPALDVVAGRAIIGRTGAGDDLECFMIINYIFVLYCVVGCELSQPNHRIIRAFDTIERCDEVKRNVESAKTVYSCERTAFEKDK